MAAAPLPEPVEFHTFGDRAIHRVFLECGQDNSKTSRRLCEQAAAMNPPKKGPTRKMVKKAVDRHAQGRTDEYLRQKRAWKAKPAGGRLQALDAIGLQFLKDEAEELKRTNAIIRPGQEALYKKILDERLKMVVRLGVESSVESCDPKKYELSDRCLRSLAKKICPEQRFVKRGTLRREEAKAEIRNAISSAAVAGSVFRRTNPDCIVTTDHLAIYINSKDQLKVVYAAAGSQDSMRKQRVSMAHADEDAEESSEGDVKMPCMCSMTMSGKVISCVAEIWDDQLQPDADGARVKIYALDPTDSSNFLSASTYKAYIAHGTPHELVMWEVYTKVVIPKANIIRHKIKQLAAAQRSTGVLPPVPSVVRPFAGSVSSTANVSSQSIGGGVARPQQQHQSIGEGVARPQQQHARPQVYDVWIPPDGPNEELRAQMEQARGNPFIRFIQTAPLLPQAPAPAPAPAPHPMPEEEDAESEEDDLMSNGTWVGDPSEFDLVLCMDGDSAPLTAFLDKDRMRSFKDSRHPKGRQSIQELILANIWGTVALLKWAAACSMLQSPNDVGHTHPILRKGTKGSKNKKTVTLPWAQCGPGLRSAFTLLFSPSIGITAARKRGFWRLLSNLPKAVAEAFRERTVVASWRDCGYYPLSIPMILDKCSLWRKSAAAGGLSAQEKQLILDGIPALQDIAWRCGRVSDAEILTQYPFLSRYPTLLQRDLGHMAVNRDRCVLVMHPSYFEARENAAEAARQADPSLRAPAKKKTIKPLGDVAWELYSVTMSPKCTVEEIKSQLFIRNIVIPVHSTKKPALLLLWQTHSQIPDQRCAAARPSAAAAVAPAALPAASAAAAVAPAALPAVSADAAVASATVPKKKGKKRARQESLSLNSSSSSPERCQRPAFATNLVLSASMQRLLDGSAQ
jgi:hypothetical protein